MEELRPSFEERDRYLDALSSAYADGRLDDAEFDWRSRAVLSATTHREALSQFQGLPDPRAFTTAPNQRSRPTPSRRLLLVGGAAALGLASFAWIRVVHEPATPASGEAEVVSVGATALDSTRLWAAEPVLQSANLTSIVSLKLTDENLSGAAAGAGTEMTDFAVRSDGEVVLEATHDRGELPSVDLADFVAQFDVALGSGMSLIQGDPVEAELTWTQQGRPALAITTKEGDKTRIGVVDLDGSLISLADG